MTQPKKEKKEENIGKNSSVTQTQAAAYHATQKTQVIMHAG